MTLRDWMTSTLTAITILGFFYGLLIIGATW